MAEEEASDGAGKAWQELAVGAAFEAMQGLLNDLLGGQALLAGGGGATDAEQAGDLGDLQATVAMQEEMTEQTGGVVVGTLLLAEVKDGSQEGLHLRRQTLLRDLCLSQPGGKVIRRYCHGTLPRAFLPGLLYSVALHR